MAGTSKKRRNARSNAAKTAGKPQQPVQQDISESQAAPETENIKTLNILANFLAKQLESEHEKLEDDIKNYPRDRVKSIVTTPEQNQTELIDLSNYIYRHSGYFRRIIDYFVNMALCCWTVDTEVLNDEFYKTSPEELSKSFIGFAGAAGKLNIEKELHDIFIRVFLEDACFAYFIETDTDTFLYYLPSGWCSVRMTVNGVNMYGIEPRAVSQDDAAKLPSEIQELLRQRVSTEDPYVYPAPEKCFCVKYNTHFTYLYPPLFDLLKNIIEIDDYKALGKVQSETENYNLLGFEIPVDVNSQDHLLLTDAVVSMFI